MCRMLGRGIDDSMRAALPARRGERLGRFVAQRLEDGIPFLQLSQIHQPKPVLGPESHQRTSLDLIQVTAAHFTPEQGFIQRSEFGVGKIGGGFVEQIETR